jgi:pumilio family protein 6
MAKEIQKPKKKFPKTKSEDNKSDIKFVKSDKRRSPVDSNVKNMRRLYNRLMQKSKESKKEINKVDLVSKLLKTVNGNYAELCFKHDGCRVLQGSIKYGDKKQRAEIIKALIPHVYELVIKKYSIYLAIKMFKFAEQKEREEIINKAILPNFSKIIKSSNGQLFLNFVYDNSSPSSQKIMIDYYINKYLKISEDRLKNQNQNIINVEKSSDMIINEMQGTFDGENVKTDLKAHLEKQLEIGVHKNFLFQAFLNKVFDFLDVKTKSYISELFDDDVTEFLNNKAGIELACKIFTVASAKTRKKVIKKIKDNLKSLLSNENSILFLIKVILFNDDTKLVEKHVLKILIDCMHEEVMQNKNILKVLMNIITPFNPRVNNPYENNILQYQLDSASKKDEKKRWIENISLMINDIFQCINPNTKFFITDPSYSTLLVEVIHLLASQEEGSLDEGAASNTQMLKELLNNIYSTINIDYQNNYDDLNTTLLGEKTSHFVLNRLIKSLVKEEDMSEKMNGNVIEIIQEFLNNLWTVICNNLEGYLNTKCIFVIVSLIEAAKKIKNEHKFLNDLKKYQNLIKNKAGDKSMIAFGILNKIIS